MVGRPQFMRGLSKLFTAVIIGALFALPASAMAQSSQGGYNQPGGVVQDQIQAEPAQAEDQVDATPASVTAAAPANDSAELPFTGLDLALVVGAGGVLLLLGLGIRRFTRTSELV
jgi:predicted cobalt transporter CbtA